MGAHCECTFIATRSDSVILLTVGKWFYLLYVCKYERSFLRFYENIMFVVHANLWCVVVFVKVRIPGSLHFQICLLRVCVCACVCVCLKRCTHRRSVA